MRKLWHGLVNGLLALMLMWAGAPTIAQPEAAMLAASGVYEEDFSSYAAKDYTENIQWDVWTDTLHLTNLDETSQTYPAITMDGNGNSFVVWEDRRNGNADIYAQKLDTAGNRLWIADIRVNSDTGASDQQRPQIVADSSGNVIVIWEDYRNNYSGDIYAQKLDGNGNHFWVTDARVNDEVVAERDSPAVSMDQNGEAVIVWSDKRNTDWDIFMQRLSSAGNRVWAADIRVNSDSDSADQYDPDVAVNSEGNAIVAWSDRRGTFPGVYVQRLDRVGDKLWQGDKRILSSWWWFYDPDDNPKEHSPAITADSDNNVIVAWIGERPLPEGDDVYAQKLDVDGQGLWPLDLRVSADEDGSGRHSPDVVVDSNGSVVVTWLDDDHDVYAQKLNEDGNRLVEVDVRVIVHQTQPGELLSVSGLALTIDENNDPLIVWADDYNAFSDTYIQKLDEQLTHVWLLDVLVNSAVEGKVYQGMPAVAVDADDNAIVVWIDRRNGDDDVYAQKYSQNGTKLWASDVRVNADGQIAEREYPDVAVDNNGNAVVVWKGDRVADDMYVQKVDSNGNRMWPTDIRVTNAAASIPSVAVDSEGKAVVVWRYYSFHDNQGGDIYAQKFDENGHRMWATDILVNSDTISHYQWDPMVVTVGDSSSIVVWRESPSGDYGDIYAQKLDSTGDRVWPIEIRVHSNISAITQFLGDIALDYDGNVIVVWTEESVNTYQGTYAQEIDLNGNRLWATDVTIDSGLDEGASWDNISVSADGNNEVVVTWEDNRSGNRTVCARRYDQTWTQLWATDVRVSADTRALDRSGSAIDILENGDAIIVWQDARNGSDDIYAQRISVVGSRRWLADLQIVVPDSFYFPTGVVQSRTIDTITADILQVTLTANIIPNGGNVQLYLTNNGGAHWATVTPGVTHVFTTTGSDLRWRAVLTGDPVWRHRSPVVNSLRIEYSTDAPDSDDYEPDDLCGQAQPLQISGAVQRHDFHQYQDSDWGWFDAQAGTPYLIQTSNTGFRADTVLELYDSCGVPPIDEDDNAFSPGATLTFTAPTDMRYYVRVFQNNPHIYGADTEYDLSVQSQQPTGAAIIVAGRLKTNDAVQPIINATANLAYRTLLQRGFAAEDIYYLNSDTTQPGVDGTPTKAHLRDAVQDWARTRVGLGAPLWLFLVDHGNVDRFHNEIAEVVTAEELNLWLSNLEATSGVDQINVIVDACFSGSFIDTQQSGAWGTHEISGHGRVVIASTTSRWWAYAPPIVGGQPTPVMYFSGGFWRALGEGQTLWHAFLAGRSEVESAAIGRCGDYAYTCQRPWLDDTGDAWFDARDGLVAQQRGLAVAFAGEVAPYIDWAEAGEIQAGRATLRAQVRDDGSVTRVWARVFGPSFTPPTSTDGSIPVIIVPEATLTRSAGDIFMADYPDFTEPGAYQVVLYALDDEGHTSAPRAVMVGAQKVYLPLVLRQQ